MAYRSWVCESCSGLLPFRHSIWNCVECNKEICDHCFDMYAHCKQCSAEKTREELRLAANAKGWDFEKDTA